MKFTAAETATIIEGLRIVQDDGIDCQVLIDRITANAEQERKKAAAGIAVARANGVVFGRKPKWQGISLSVIEAAVEAAGSLRKAQPVLGIPLTTLRARWKEIQANKAQQQTTEQKEIINAV